MLHLLVTTGFGWIDTPPHTHPNAHHNHPLLGLESVRKGPKGVVWSEVAEQTAERRESPGTMAPVSLVLGCLLATMWIFASASVDLDQQQQEKQGEFTLHFISRRSKQDFSFFINFL